MIELSVLDTLLALLPLAMGTAIFFWQLGRVQEIAIAGARMVLQLVAIGYLLTFLFEYEYSWLGLSVMSFMVSAASWIAIRPMKQKSFKSFATVAVALIIGGGINLAWMLLAVLKLDPWYQPRLVIPLAGMVFSLGMNTLSIAIERFENEEESDRAKAVKAAINAAMISHVNTLLAVGLVSLPGMMTGQILSGVSPLIAVRYQIMVMSMIIGTSTLALVAYFWIRNEVELRLGKAENSEHQSSNRSS